MDSVQKKRRFLPIALTVSLFVGTIVVTPHVSAGSISDLQNQYAQLQQQEQQLQSQIASQKSAAQAAQVQLNTLNEQVNVTKQQIALLQQQVDTTNAAIQTKQKAIADTQSQIRSNMDLLKKRLRALYENGQDTYLDVLLSSNSISNFLSRMEIVRTVSNHDQQVIARLKQEQNQLQTDQQALQKTQADLQQMQSTMAAKQDVLNVQIFMQSQIVAQAQASAQAAQQQATSVTAQASQTQAQITVALAMQAAAESGAQATGSSAGADTSTGPVRVGGSSLSGSVLAYQSTVKQFAAQYGMSAYVNLILAVMQQESNGEGGDPMQSSEGPFNTRYPNRPNAITDPIYSIQCGIQELHQNLQLAGCTGPTDITGISLGLQGTNFGSGFISWAKSRGGYSLANAQAFAQIEEAIYGCSSYGDPNYVPHVLRYYNS